MERYLIFFLFMTASQLVMAYGKPTHDDIANKTISMQFAISQPSYQTGNLTDFQAYLVNILNINPKKYYLFNGVPDTTGEEWLRQGSRDEDNGYRPLNHFYDPVYDDSLSSGMNRRYNFPNLSNSNKTPDWALEDTAGIANQDLSLKDAQDYLYAALTIDTINHGPGLSNREYLAGKYFYALGHVLHLLADMGQPEHVRIDQHFVIGDPDPNWLDRILQYYSFYERYTDTRSRSLMSDLEILANKSNTPYPYRPTDIKTARQLWIDRTTPSAPKGLSVYTNSNFVSNDTSFDTSYYPSPAPNPNKTCVPLSMLLDTDGATAPIDPRVGEQINGDMCFIASTVTDRNQSNQQTVNERAASYSIFNNEVNKYHDDCLLTTVKNGARYVFDDCKRYTMNRWNFDSAHAFLMPRIVGYGNALLEHLYRGRMEILPPTAAQALDFQAAPLVKGVSQLPLMLKNTTPNEAMVPGKLVAVVTYVNSNNEVVEVITSDEVTGAPPQTKSQPFTFIFTKRAFPLNMDGLTAYIQVIFRGQLGEDKDTIVVARKPLSEIILPFTLTADLPDSGVYAAIDHSNIGTEFTSLTMKLSSSVQIDGTLVPSASYHKDNCFSSYIDCNGSYSRTPEGYTSNADAFSVNALNLPMTMTFANGIPPNATDLFINFVNFRTDPTQPVGIAFVDISEPTFISFINSTDYTSFKSEYKSYQEIEAILTPQSTLLPDIKPAAVEVEIIFGTNNIVSAKIGSLPIAQYSRIAILTDDKGFSLLYNAKRLDATNTNINSNQAWYPATVHQDVMGPNGSNGHSFSGVSKLRNVISNINILLEYKPVMPLPDMPPADKSILPDATLSKEAPLIY